MEKNVNNVIGKTFTSIRIAWLEYFYFKQMLSLSLLRDHAASITYGEIKSVVTGSSLTYSNLRRV